MSDTITQEDIEKVPEEQKTGEVNPKALFVAEYNELCKKYNLQHAAEPLYKLRDDGSFSTVIRYSLIPLK